MATRWEQWQICVLGQGVQDISRALEEGTGKTKARPPSSHLLLLLLQPKINSVILQVLNSSVPKLFIFKWQSLKEKKNIYSTSVVLWIMKPELWLENTHMWGERAPHGSSPWTQSSNSSVCATVLRKTPSSSACVTVFKHSTLVFCFGFAFYLCKIL